MIKSFQMKLALLSTLISAGVLGILTIGTLHFVEDSHQQRLDRDLVGLAHQMLGSGSHSLDTAKLSSDQLAIYGEELRGTATLLTNRYQRIIFQSENWPGELTAALLPQATQVEHTRLPAHSHGDHNRDGDHEVHNGHSLHEGRVVVSGGTLVEPHFKTVSDQGRQWRLVGLSFDGNTLYAALDLARFNSNLHNLKLGLIVIVLIALFISALGAWLVARRALKPLRNLTELTEGITASGLGQRIEDSGSDQEFARLIRVFNEMLERLDGSFRQAVRFSADASHELKTPLTIMQGEVETALQRAEVGSDAQLTFASQLEEIQRLNSLVGKLLLLSHADSGALKPTCHRFDFGELVQRVSEDIPALDSSLTVDCQVEMVAEIEGDQDLLRQVVQNLAVNAVSYNRPNGWVRCELEKTTENVVLRVSNSSEPIPLDQQEKIFQRFYRIDKARTGDHTGLGLSLAREISKVHGGQLKLISSDLSGTVFELHLPVS